MQTHEDRDFDFRRLKERADSAMMANASMITAGAPGEKPLVSWDAMGVRCTRMPDDEQKILRISLGGGVPGIDINYCVFRGNRQQCIDLMEMAVQAMKRAP